MKRLLYLAALATCSPAVSAAATLAHDEVEGTSFVLGQGNPLPAAPYRMTAIADLDGDGFDDMGVLVGESLMVLFSPALYEVLVPNVLEGIHDIAGVPAARPHRPDHMAAVGPQGAELLGWDEQGFTQRVVGPGWIDALCVEAVPRQGTEARQLVGLMADGVTVRRLTEDPHQPDNPWFDTLVCTLKTPARELALANLDGRGLPELGLMGDAGAELRTWQGSLLATYGLSGQALALNRVRATTSKEWLALLGSDATPSNPPFIATLDAGGLLRVDSLPAGSALVGMTASDLDATGDGVEDLILSNQVDHSAIFLQNTGDALAGPVFDPDPVGAMRFIPLGLTGPASTNQVTPASTDFDNDGDADLLHPIQQDGTFFVFLSARIEQDELKPTIDTRFPPRFVAGPTIQIDTVLAVDGSIVTAGGRTPNVLEVFLYRRPDIDSPMDVVPVFAERYPVAGGIPGNAGELFFPCTVPLLEVPDGGCTHFDAMYFLVARLAVEEDGAIIERAPTRLFGIQGQLDGDNSAYLSDHSSKPENRVGFLHDCLGGIGTVGAGPGQGGGHGGTRVGPGLQLVTLENELGGSGDELDCLPKPTAGNKPPNLSGS